jgi:hypothetical protein
MAAVLLGCTEDQSKNIGNAPKATIDKVTTDVNKAMQAGASIAAKADEKENK